MNAPANPHAAEAAADIRAYNAPLLANPSRFDYYLTWPAEQCGVATIAGQWKRDEQGLIQAWYTAAQLREVLDVMQVTAAHAAPKGERRDERNNNRTYTA